MCGTQSIIAAMENAAGNSHMRTSLFSEYEITFTHKSSSNTVKTKSICQGSRMRLGWRKCDKWIAEA